MYPLLVYSGMWVDKDKDPRTGVLGREGIMIGNDETATLPIGIGPDPCDGIDESVKLLKLDTRGDGGVDPVIR